MTDLHFIRAFDGDTVSIIPADNETAELLLTLPPHQPFTVSYQDSIRTPKQNSSVRIYCRLLANSLNEAGIDMRDFPWRETFRMPWSEYTVMDFLWRAVQEAMIGEKSTKKLNTKQVSEVYQVVDQRISANTGIHIPFPCKEENLNAD